MGSQLCCCCTSAALTRSPSGYGHGLEQTIMLVGRSPTALYVGKLQALENDRASKAQQPLAQHGAYRSAAVVGGLLPFRAFVEEVRPFPSWPSQSSRVALARTFFDAFAANHRYLAAPVLDQARLLQAARA
jgi:hypothetical protein